MNEPVLHEDFRDLLFELQATGARYLVVDAHAMAVHGVPRATGDLDILVAPDSENAARVVQALTAFGAPLSTACRERTSRSRTPSTSSECRRDGSIS